MNIIRRANNLGGGIQTEPSCYFGTCHRCAAEFGWTNVFQVWINNTPKFLSVPQPLHLVTSIYLPFGRIKSFTETLPEATTAPFEQENIEFV